MKIYVASSWRNKYQQDVVRVLREAGHEVYDFRNPKPGDVGFSWSEIDENWLSWSQGQFIEALRHPIANSGYTSDATAMWWADCCVLVLPCGRSAHTEAGWMCGAGKLVLALIPEQCEPELMYKLFQGVVATTEELLQSLKHWGEVIGK